MLKSAVTILAITLGAHILVKFAFFAAPYRKRRAALDKAYGNGTSATSVSDAVSLVVAALFAVLLFVRGVEAVSFLIGLWIGATLIQLYFHRFHEPLNEDEAPPAPVSPIKMMSYAIQASPWRAWRELLLFAALVVAGIVLILK